MTNEELKLMEIRYAETKKRGVMYTSISVESVLALISAVRELQNENEHIKKTITAIAPLFHSMFVEWKREWRINILQEEQYVSFRIIIREYEAEKGKP